MPKAGSTTARGYGAAHQRKRAEYQKQVDAGTATCWRCGKAIRPGDDWHAGHDDHDRTKYAGIECPPCNLKAGGQAGAAVTNAKWSTTVRDW
jgi:DNA-directed RNA polymerase subunit RPC12/RpoP